METEERKYSHKDVDMLISANTLCNNFSEHKPVIVAVRPLWADPFIGDFKTRIDDAIANYLGLDPKKDLKSATQAVYAIQTDSMNDLSLFNAEIKSDYATNLVRLDYILGILGFTAHYADVLNKDQEALIELLYKFKLNMDAPLTTEITGLGTNPVLVSDISGYADTLKDADVTQETLKTSSKVLTAEAVAEFNAIYAQSMAICKISVKIKDIKADEAIKAKFVFGRLVNALNAPRRPPQEEAPPEGGPPA